MSLFENFLQDSVGQTTIASKDLWRDNFKYDGSAQTTMHLQHYDKLPAIRKHNVIKRELSEELQYLTETDNCMYCYAQYQLIDNLGTHKCTYHPNPSTDPRTFRCCGVSKQYPGFYSKGCVPCDHSPRNYNQKNPHAPRWNKDSVFTRVPKAVRHLLKFPDSSVVGEETNPHDPIKSFLIVTRVRGYTLHDI